MISCKNKKSQINESYTKLKMFYCYMIDTLKMVVAILKNNIVNGRLKKRGGQWRENRKKCKCDKRVYEADT